MDNVKTIQQVATETRILENLLREVEEGDVLTYEDMSAAIGKDILGNRTYMYTALRHLVDEGVFFGTVRGVGLVRQNAEESLSHGDAAIKLIRGASRRGARKMENVEYDKLSHEGQEKRNVNLTLLRMNKALLRPKNVRILEGKISDVPTVGEITQKFFDTIEEM